MNYPLRTYSRPSNPTGWKPDRVYDNGRAEIVAAGSGVVANVFDEDGELFSNLSYETAQDAVDFLRDEYGPDFSIKES